MVPFLRSAFNYDVDAASNECGLDCSVLPSLTRQEFVEECDINTILRRFGITGQLPDNVRMPTYGDFVGVRDFHSAANAIAQAREAFDTMPAEVRSRFENDPGKFVDFCSDDNNLEEARRLGLVPPVAAPLGGVSSPAVSAPTGVVESPSGAGAPNPITNT